MVMGAEGVGGARQAKGSAGGGRSLKRKSHHSGKFWFSDPMVRPDLGVGTDIEVIAHGTIMGSDPINGV